MVHLVGINQKMIRNYIIANFSPRSWIRIGLSLEVKEMSNNSSFTGDHTAVDCDSHKTFKLVSGIVICLSGFFLNVSILLVLLGRRQLSTVNTIVLHLALSDTIVFLANGPYLFLSFFNQKLAFSSIPCQVGAFSGRFTTTVTLYLLTVMSLSRYYSLAKPFKYRMYVTAPKANKVCIGAWVVTFLQSLTPVLGWGKYAAIDGQCYCALDSSKHRSNWFVHLLLAFAFPLALNSWIFARSLSLVNLRGAKKGKIPRKLQMKRTVNLATENQVGSSSESQNHRENTAENNQTNSGVSASELNLEQTKKKPKETEEVHVEVVKVKEENSTEKEPDFVNEGFEDEITNAPEEIIMADWVNEGGTSNETETVNQGIESDKQASVSSRSNHETKISVGNTNIQNKRKDRRCRQQEDELNDMEKNEHNDSKIFRKTQDHKRERKINMVVSLLFLAYIIGCGPTYIVWTWFALYPNSVPRTAFVLFRWFAGVQSVINPFIYGFMNAEIRTDVFALWKNVKCHIRSH